MIALIEWFNNAHPVAFCFGLIGLALLVKVIYEILTAK